MDARTRNLVRQGAGQRCEYCHLPDEDDERATRIASHFFAGEEVPLEDADHAATMSNHVMSGVVFAMARTGAAIDDIQSAALGSFDTLYNRNPLWAEDPAHGTADIPPVRLSDVLGGSAAPDEDWRIYLLEEAYQREEDGMDRIYLQGDGGEKIYLHGEQGDPIYLHGEEGEPIYLKGEGGNPIYLNGPDGAQVTKKSAGNRIYLHGHGGEPIYLSGEGGAKIYLKGGKEQGIYLHGPSGDPIYLTGSDNEHIYLHASSNGEGIY